MKTFCAFNRVIHRELLLAFRTLSQVMNPLFFFIITLVLFPLSMSSDGAILQVMAPGIIWMAVLFSLLLSVDRLFVADADNGILDQWFLSSTPMPWLVLAKIIGHWLVAVLPLILLSPVAAFFLHLSWHQCVVLLMSLVLGTPVIVLVTALAAAFTLSSNQRGMLMALIVFPLVIPVMIFGGGCLSYAIEGHEVGGLLALLMAFFLLALMSLPFAITAALRISLAD